MSDFAELVRKSGLLTSEKLAFALEERKRTGFRLGQILVDHGILDESDLYEAVAAMSGYERLDMSTAQVELTAAQRIDPEFALDHRMMPLRMDARLNTVWVATSDPTQSELLFQIGSRFSCAPTPIIATESELGRLIRHAYFNETLDRTRGGSTLTLVNALASAAEPMGEDVGDSEKKTVVRARALPPFPDFSKALERAETEPGGPIGLVYPSRRPPVESSPSNTPVPLDRSPTTLDKPGTRSSTSRRAEHSDDEVMKRAVPSSRRASSGPPPLPADAADPPQAEAAPPLASELGIIDLSSRADIGARSPDGSVNEAHAVFAEAPSAMGLVSRADAAPLEAPPLSTTGTPLSTTGTPLSTTGTPLSTTGTPLSTAAPALSSASPAGPAVGPPRGEEAPLRDLAPVVQLHEYTAAAIEAVFELCIARGIITREEYLARLGAQDLPRRKL